MKTEVKINYKPIAVVPMVLLGFSLVVTGFLQEADSVWGAASIGIGLLNLILGVSRMWYGYLKLSEDSFQLAAFVFPKKVFLSDVMSCRNVYGDWIVTTAKDEIAIGNAMVSGKAAEIVERYFSDLADRKQSGSVA